VGLVVKGSFRASEGIPQLSVGMPRVTRLEKKNFARKCGGGHGLCLLFLEHGYRKGGTGCNLPRTAHSHGRLGGLIRVKLGMERKPDNGADP